MASESGSVMETPKTKAGEATSEIMRVFTCLGPMEGNHVHLDNPQFNAIYSHILKTLEKQYGE